MASKGTTEKAVENLDSKEVDFFVDRLAELLLSQVDEANQVDPSPLGDEEEE